MERLSHEELGDNEVVRLVLHSVLDFETNIPTLSCSVTKDGTQVKFRCGYCNCYHYHGNVPKSSPDKGHRVEHCHVQPSPYPSGYYLRTDLDLLYSKRYPNFAVIGRGAPAFNAHYRKCKRLGLPMVAVRKKYNFAEVDIDFVTTNFRMSGGLGTFMSTVGVIYRQLHQHRIKGKYRQLRDYAVDTREGRETASFWIFVNDAYPLADVLMPIINDRTHWTKPGEGRFWTMSAQTPVPAGIDYIRN